MSKKAVNIYDFDHTIYKGDASVDFIIYCLTRHIALWRYLPINAYAFVHYVLGTWSRKKVKEYSFKFLESINDVDAAVEAFWVKHQGKIKSWYLDSKEKTDIIVSASPEFLLSPITNKLGATLIATKMDSLTGKIKGKNCRGEEKVSRLHKYDKELVIDKFYSDSLSDAPLLKRAKQSFIVKGDKLIPYKDYIPSSLSKFTNPEFIRFLIVGGVNSLLGVVFAFIILKIIGSNPLLAWVIGYMLSLVPSYFLNSFFTFKSRNFNIRQFGSFVASYMPNFLIQLACVQLLINILHVAPLISYILAVAIAVPITFILLTTQTFTKKRG